MSKREKTDWEKLVEQVELIVQALEECPSTKSFFWEVRQRKMWAEHNRQMAASQQQPAHGQRGE